MNTARVVFKDNFEVSQTSEWTFTITYNSLNPANLFALMPAHRNSFSPDGGLVVTHGGVSLDEVVVPFIRIDRQT